MSVLEAVDPRTGQPGKHYPVTSLTQMRERTGAARAAFDSDGWRSAEARAGALTGLAERLRSRGSEIVGVASAETGLSTGRLEGELERTWRQLLLFAAVVRSGEHYDVRIDFSDRDARPVPRPDLRRMMVPIGPVAVFAASNFPLAFSVAGGDTASALAAACPVICKAHPGHPGTSELVAQEVSAALDDEHLPPAWFSLVQTDSVDDALALVQDDAVEAVAFTGSLRAGRAIFDAAAARPRPIPVFAEMGSVNPVIVAPGALAERTAEIAAALGGALTRDAGQLCTKPGLIFAPSGTAGEAFASALQAQVQSADPGPMLGRRLYEAARTAGGELAEHSGVDAVVSAAQRESDDGFTLGPSVFATSTAALGRYPELLEERFGPIALLVTYDDVDDLLGAIDLLPGQLTGTVHAEDTDADLARSIAEALLPRVGRLIFDGVPTGVSVTAAMQHGGPYPATTSPAYTSVGTAAIQRFLRPVVWQNAPQSLLPDPLLDSNPMGIPRAVDGQRT